MLNRHRLQTIASRAFVVFALVAMAFPSAAAERDAKQDATKPIKVGSKRFTESYILGEIVRRTLADRGIAAIHKAGLGNTGILVAALEAGEIDIYPEYTGTIVREILKRDGNPTIDELNRLLEPKHLKVAVPLGFSNSYALAMREDEAAARGITRIGDLADASRVGGSDGKSGSRELHLGLSNEFLARADGWPALKAAYALPIATPSGLDHGLAYDALAQKRVDVIDIYSTDARIGRDRLRVLIDDRHFFPSYEAVLLMRRDLDAAPFQRLVGAIDTARMIALNGRAELDGISFAEVAKEFMATSTATSTVRAPATSAELPTARDRSSGLSRFFAKLFGPDFWRLLYEHVVLVAGSVIAAAIVGIPLGVWAARSVAAGRVILNVVGLLQTVPSLALLALLIAALGTIGTVPALIALFLYALLPIVANTCAGLGGVSRGIVQAAAALGLSGHQRLALVELPLAAPTIVTGIRTAAVINVGTATMAAFVGAGGFGERITAGLALNDGATMLAGAVPAAVLALMVQALFDTIGRRIDSTRHARQ